MLSVVYCTYQDELNIKRVIMMLSSRGKFGMQPVKLKSILQSVILLLSAYFMCAVLVLYRFQAQVE